MLPSAAVVVVVVRKMGGLSFPREIREARKAGRSCLCFLQAVVGLVWIWAGSLDSIHTERNGLHFQR